jgi:hypothetical protein
MRSKIVIPVLVLALGLFGAAIVISKGRRPKPVLVEAQQVEPVVPAATDGAEPGGNGLSGGANDRPTIYSRLAVAPPDTNHAEYIHQRITELTALAMNDDTNSLNTILSELANPDPQIRKGALEAVIQFGDRSVIPHLKEVADQTESTAEKADILAAIDFLSLPTLMEFRATQKGKAPAMAQMNSASTNRVSRSPFQRRQPTPAPQTNQ